MTGNESKPSWRRIEKIMIDAAHQVISERGSPRDDAHKLALPDLLTFSSHRSLGISLGGPEADAGIIVAAHRHLLAALEHGRTESALDAFAAMVEAYVTMNYLEWRPAYLSQAKFEADLRRGGRARDSHGDTEGRCHEARKLKREGLQNKEIASRLGVSLRTVSRYLNSR